MSCTETVLEEEAPPEAAVAFNVMVLLRGGRLSQVKRTVTVVLAPLARVKLVLSKLRSATAGMVRVMLPLPVLLTVNVPNVCGQGEVPMVCVAVRDAGNAVNAAGAGVGAGVGVGVGEPSFV